MTDLSCAFSAINMARKRNTRQSEVIDPDVVFPAIPHFKEPKKLPLHSDVIGVLRYETQKSNTDTNDIINDIVERIYCKYWHDTVYCVYKQTIKKRVQVIWDVFKAGKKKFGIGKESGKEIVNYKELCKKVDQLFDCFASDALRQQQCFEEWGVEMSKNDV